MKRSRLVLLSAFAVVGCGGTTPNVPPPPPQVSVSGDGVHLVGEGFPPGRYVAEFTGRGIAGCGWQRLSGPENIESARIDGGFASGSPTYITVEPTDVALYTGRCGTLTSAPIE